MAVLVVAKFDGDPEQLVTSIEEHLDPLMSRIAPERGAQWHSLSKSPEGVIIVDIWESVDAANGTMALPEVQEAMQAAGLPKPRAEFHDLVSHTDL